MGRLVFILAVALGWAAFAKGRREVRRYGAVAGAYPFPTSASHGRIDAGDAAEIARWTRALDCDEQQLREAIDVVGSSEAAVQDYFARPR